MDIGLGFHRDPVTFSHSLFDNVPSRRTWDVSRRGYDRLSDLPSGNGDGGMADRERIQSFCHRFRACQTDINEIA